jgi:hypothetical protein
LCEPTGGNWINCAGKHSVLREDKRWIGGSSTVTTGHVFASRRLKLKRRSPQSAKTSPFRAWNSKGVNHAGPKQRPARANRRNLERFVCTVCGHRGADVRPLFGAGTNGHRRLKFLGPAGKCCNDWNRRVGQTSSPGFRPQPQANDRKKICPART